MLKVQTWRLPREASSEQDIHSFAQVMRGRSIEGNRDFVRLGREVFREHWLELLPGFVGDFNANISAIPRLHAVQESQATGEWFAARWHLDRLLAVEPENTDLLVQRGLASVNLLDWAAAIRDFEKAAAPKKTVSLLTRLARANLELAHFDQTIRHTTEGLGLKPDDRNLYMLRAEAYAATQAWDKAATDLLEAIKLRPRMTSGYQRLSIVRLQQGQPEEYRAQCARLLELLKDDDNIGGFVAWACVLLDRAVPDPEVPVRLVTRILADNPDSYRLLNNAGAALYRAGHFQKAFQKLDESRATYTRAAGLAQLRGDPNAVLMPVQDGRPVDWLFLAMTHAKLGNPREAEEWLKKADDAITRKSVAELGGTWRRLELKILLDEATALIRGLGPKP